MRHPVLTSISVVAAVVLASAAIGQQSISAGPWRAALGPSGPGEILYGDEIIARSGAFNGYLPEWKGQRFSMAGARLQSDGGRATWTKEIEGNQRATVTLELSAESCRYWVETTITQAGPSEFSLTLSPEALRADESQLFTWQEDVPKVISLDSTFERIGGITSMRFERADRTVILTCDGFEIQDRRAGGSGLFLVDVIGSSGAQPITVQRSIELRVEPAPAESLEARKVLLAQRPQELLDQEVKNAGFEQEGKLSGWSENSHAAADREVKHSGEQSARLEILQDPERRGDVYLTQVVPIQEGALYQASAWVRAQDIKRADPNGMGSTGAAVLLEFADKKGAWYAAGAYAKGLYGTVNWTRISTSPVRAPMGSGFAIIYLAMRAHGTAWFDDVKLTEVRRHAVLLSPLPEEQVADNTPRLNWYYPAGAPSAVDLCKDPAFAADVVTLDDVREVPVALKTPIAPGTWYWRIRVPEMGYASPAWRFSQTAPLEQDCTEPQIAVSHGHLSRADQPVEIAFSDNVGVTEARLTVDGEDASAQAKLGKESITYAPAGGWTPGLHRLSLEVADAEGNRASRKLFWTYSPDLPRSVWLRDTGFETDGKRHFYLGMYGIRIEDMPQMREAGLHFVHNYQWDGTGTNEQALEYLDAAAQNELQVFIGISRARLMAGDEDFVAERVGALMGHPALFCWYLYDEPDLTHQYVSPIWVERYYHLIKALDPFHPVVVTCAGDAAVPLYKDCFDVHWTQVYGATSFVSSRIPRHRSSMNPGTPLSAILHCYDRAQSGAEEFDPEKFQPDGRTMRSNAFMAIAKGSSCLSWWWWGQGGTTTATIARAPRAWADLKLVFADIQSLEPALIADGTVEMWVESPGEGKEVHVWEKRLADRALIIAVNRDPEPCELTITLKQTAGTKTARRLLEEGAAQIVDGKLQESFGPLGVHVYEVR